MKEAIAEVDRLVKSGEMSKGDAFKKVKLTPAVYYSNKKKPKAKKVAKPKAAKKPKVMTIEQIGEIKPSSKALVMILDTEEAEKFVARFIAGEVG